MSVFNIYSPQNKLMKITENSDRNEILFIYLYIYIYIFIYLYIYI